MIVTFKPKPKSPKSRTTNYTTATTATKPAKIPTTAHLTREIHFDLRLTRLSLLADIVSNVLVTLGPSPVAPTQHNPGPQTFFVLVSALTCFGSGSVPAMQSLVLCVVQARALREGSGLKSELDVGQLFGALAVLQSVGQMILGVRLFFVVFRRIQEFIYPSSRCSSGWYIVRR